MTSDRKKPGLAFWTTVALVVVLVGYPLSWGPVLGFWTWLGQPIWLARVIDVIYLPIDLARFHGPAWIGWVSSKYGNWWIELALP